jgi:hypothetical protein
MTWMVGVAGAPASDFLMGLRMNVVPSNFTL